MKQKKSKRGRKPKPASEKNFSIKVEQSQVQNQASFVKDARWTFRQDITLVKEFQKHKKNWIELSEALGTRSSYQCSIRYSWLLKNNKIKLIEKTLKRIKKKTEELRQKQEGNLEAGDEENKILPEIFSDQEIDYNIEKVEIEKRANLNQEIHKFWSHEEDLKLLHLHKKYENDENKWDQIANQLVDRNDKKCKQRYSKLIRQNPNLLRSVEEFASRKVRPRSKTWTPEQDEKLLELIKVYGDDWKKIADQLVTRSRNQAKNRYVNYLSERIENSEWTREEDQVILKMVKKVGRKYKIISTKLQGRSPAQVRNRLTNYLEKYYLIKIKYVDNEKYSSRLKRTRRLYKKKKYRQKLKLRKAQEQVHSEEQKPIKKQEESPNPIFYSPSSFLKVEQKPFKIE